MSQSLEESKVTSAPSGTERKSGRAVFDEGRTVWEWQTATGVFERYVSEEQLSRLEAAGLRLVEHPSYEAGRAIYGVDQAARQAYANRKQVTLGRPAKAARVESTNPLRQLWRRLVLST